jgi:hypothetical protein
MENYAPQWAFTTVTEDITFNEIKQIQCFSIQHDVRLSGYTDFLWMKGWTGWCEGNTGLLYVKKNSALSSSIVTKELSHNIKNFRSVYWITWWSYKFLVDTVGDERNMTVTREKLCTERKVLIL